MFDFLFLGPFFEALAVAEVMETQLAVAVFFNDELLAVLTSTIYWQVHQSPPVNTKM